ncbi:MAG: ElyC/SanA/YdcF family protein [Psychroserpens sp.]|uniref:SanA/YdcF family protein n=1 Tax=Psychroserpens sp. TaxID=2020870 RepID=UPI003C950894
MSTLKILLRLGILAGLGIVIIYGIISFQAKDYVYDSVEEIPKRKVGLLLGCSKYDYRENISTFYKHRVNAAALLFKSGKIEFILISGNKDGKGYDEPTTFKNDLIAKGVPTQNIVLDFAGFRTLDSVVRAKKIFGQTEITIISQQFHNERAIYLAKHNAMDAIGFNAKFSDTQDGFQFELREFFARPKALIDILFHVKPKRLGKTIEIK